MSNRSSSDLIVQIALVIGLIVIASFVFKVALGLLKVVAPLALLAVAVYLAWSFLEKVKARR